VPVIAIKFVRFVDAINYRLGRCAMYLIFVLIGILLWSSVSKTFFNPSLWTLEMAQFAMVAYYIFGGPYSIQLGVLCLVFYLGVLLYGAIDSTSYALQYNERSPTAWRPYMWPLKLGMCIGVFMMLLQVLSELVKDIARIRGEEI